MQTDRLTWQAASATERSGRLPESSCRSSKDRVNSDEDGAEHGARSGGNQAMRRERSEQAWPSS